MSKLSNSNNDNGGKQAKEPQPGMPRWVKVSLIIAIALLLLFVIINITGIGGKHGPMRHFGQTPPAEQMRAQHP
ncbi:hypothetical protein J7I93_24470 [Bacillus sp. ISL-47]|uniref:hypothetical protein n=1 Tax=Bacillus sp. ISL-47 TaxID=2819130 RepID=UPI001BE9D6A3|nr:hypothetical protein [Bacillus sp. ISL-47]MBT2691294.1 hypothetical protein [Bacillus sp. ISL-47]MBT2710562.1 hypothetical protein [Pseudomonas sp. ISL-84]